MERSSSKSADLHSDLTIELGIKKLPQNDPSYALIHPLVEKLWRDHLQCQLICTEISLSTFMSPDWWYSAFIILPDDQLDKIKAFDCYTVDASLNYEPL